MSDIADIVVFRKELLKGAVGNWWMSHGMSWLKWTDFNHLKYDVVNVVHMPSHDVMTSLINNSPNWPPNYHIITVMFSKLLQNLPSITELTLHEPVTNKKKPNTFWTFLWNLLFKFNLKEMKLARQFNKCHMISEKSLLFRHQEGQL